MDIKKLLDEFMNDLEETDKEFEERCLDFFRGFFDILKRYIPKEKLNSFLDELEDYLSKLKEINNDK